MENNGSYLEEKITYFKEPGLVNTQDTLRLVRERAEARGINKLVLASTRGNTARKAAEYFAGTGIKMIVVPHQYGFIRDRQLFPLELISELEREGHQVHFGTMLFHTENFYGVEVPRALANLLRTFCQGMKVCVEITLMAANAGLVTMGEKVIAIAGMGGGADTAVVAAAASSARMYDFHIREIICKPLETKIYPPGQHPPTLNEADNHRT